MLVTIGGMRGTVYRQCWCRDEATGRKLHGKCPQLGKRGHGKWYYRYEAPKVRGGKRRQPVGGPFGTKKEAEEELADQLARIGGGGAAPDRSVRLAAYLDGYLAGKVNLKDRTRATDAEAFELYWKPALGHMRLVDVRARHVAEVIGEMMRIGQVSGHRPEMLRRMLAARHDDGLARPLSPARVARMFAPFRAACNKAVPQMIAVSPCAGVELPRAPKVRPLAWTPAREDAFRAALGRRVLAAGRTLTTVERQAAWAAADLRPCPAMVWLPDHTAQFLESIAGERLSALFCLAAFCGLRRDEVIGLAWGDVDTDQRIAVVRETGGGQGLKADRGVRAVPLPSPVVSALRAWRKAQLAERLAWGEAWTDTGRVFTREDGTAVPGQWVSVRFETLAYRAGLPPVRFHDLRHGTASQYKAAGLDTKYISAVLGHSRTSFTDDVYVTLFPDVAGEAAEAAAAIVGRADARTMPARNNRDLPAEH
jgi:integrase